MNKKLLWLLALVTIGVGSAIYVIKNVNKNVGASIPTVIAVYQDSIASRISNSATSFTLVRGTDKQSRALAGFYGFVLDEGTTSEEFLTANCTATACTIVARGIDVQDGETEVAGNKYEHRRGATVKITNYPQLAILSRILNGQESASSTFSFGGGTTADNKILFADNGTANKPFLKYAESSGLWTFSDNGTDEIVMSTQVSGGFSYLNIDQDRGLVATPGSPEKVGMRLSMDYPYNGEGKQGNVSFDANNAFTTFSISTVWNDPSASAHAFGALVVTSTGQVLDSNTASSNPYDVFKFIGFNASTNKVANQDVQVAGPGSILCGWSDYGTPLTTGSYYYLNGNNGKIATTSSALTATIASSTNVEMLARVGFANTPDCLRVLQPTYRYSGTIFIPAGIASHTTYPITTGFYPAHFRVQAGLVTSQGSAWASGIHQSIAEGSPVVGGMFLNVFNTNATGTLWQTEYSDIMAWEVNTSTDAYDSEGQIESVTSNGFTFHQYEANRTSVLPLVLRYTVTSE